MLAGGDVTVPVDGEVEGMEVVETLADAFGDMRAAPWRRDGGGGGGGFVVDVELGG
jgi:hypothetical protein